MTVLNFISIMSIIDIYYSFIILLNSFTDDEIRVGMYYLYLGVKMNCDQLRTKATVVSS